MDKSTFVAFGVFNRKNGVCPTTQQPITIPYSLLERFLTAAIPEAAEIWSLMRTESEGDSFSPKLRDLLDRLKVGRWAELYMDPANETKAKLLMFMSPADISALNARVLAMSPEQQSEWLAKQFIELEEFDSELDDSPPITSDQFESLPDAERKELLSKWQQFYGFFMPMLLNYMARMIHRKSLYQLVAEASAGDDSSFLKAIQIDKTTLSIIPYFVERSRRAADEGDFSFQRQINTYRNKPIFVTRLRHPMLWLVFSILDEMNVLGQFEEDKEAFLDMCQRLGVYGPTDDNADVQSFAARLREFKKDQKRLTPEPEQTLIVKDVTSSKSRP